MPPSLAHAVRRPVTWALRQAAGVPRARYLDRPVFVVACGRSGSTALCAALDQHPALLVGAAEAVFIRPIGAMAHDYAGSEGYMRSSVQLDAEELARELRRLAMTTALGSDYGFAYDPRRTGEKRSVFTAPRALERWGAKAFPDEDAADGLLWLYPEARFVYLFRNGLDVVHSMSKFGSFKRREFEGRCEFWAERAFRYEYLRGHDLAVTVRFEDFVADNAAELGRVFRHLGLADDPGPAAFASSTLVHPLDQKTTEADPKEVLAQRRKGYEAWDDEQCEIFKRVCGDAMDLLGYEIPF